ncbi:MAG: GntR family transcriptional regulator [Bacillota bacterium]
MNDMPIGGVPLSIPKRRGGDLSYKYQRLRERIRQAILSGELSGRLPGERELARRFHANPKTLGKAMTDLVGEGLLERSIGRGTFIRGSMPSTAPADSKWLILCDSDQTSSPMVTKLLELHPDSIVASADSPARPSFINQFNTVIDLSSNTPESFHRDLLVRSIRVLLIGRDSGAIRSFSVLLDRAHAALQLTRGLVLAGHRRILVIEQSGDTTVSETARKTAARFSSSVVETAAIDNIPAITDRSYTAILCDGQAFAERIHRLALEYPHLAYTSLVAVGMYTDQPPCTGIYIAPAELASAGVNLLQDGQPHRPTTLYLTGTYIDRASVHAIPESQSNPITPPEWTILSA